MIEDIDKTKVKNTEKVVKEKPIKEKKSKEKSTTEKVPKEKIPKEKSNKEKNNKEKNITDMRSHILSVASTLMTEKGVKETTLKDIAKEAGISKGTLYYYYSAKEDIIYDIADLNLREISQGLSVFSETFTEGERAEKIFKELFERILAAETKAKLHLYLLNDATTGNERVAERFEARYNDWTKSLEDGLSKILNEGNMEDNKALAHLLIALVDGLVIQKICGVKDIPIDGIVELVFRGRK